MTKPLARVHVISLGGTITMTGTARGGVHPTLSADALLRDLPSVREVAHASAETATQAPGASLKIDDILRLSGSIQTAVASGAEGVVVVQGTDTLEEAAFVADLIHDGAVPLVFTGAMRNPGQPGADGAANLLDAIRVAASVEVRGCGVVVCMGGELHAARLARKTHSFSPAAFSSPGGGAIGYVAEERVRVVLRPRPARTIDVASLRDRPPVPVALYRVALDDDGRVLELLSSAEYQGVVLEAFGAGHIPEWMVPAVERLADSVPVILVSRTGAGEVLRSTYAFPGSERDLLARGILCGGSLDGLKARLLLSLSLRAGHSREDLAILLSEWGG